ncbi:hypothetical protein [Tropicibacter naphthalenivorans]|uniref:Pentapeptide repeat-containing protein n=1 Tax=Tropicibacter naphthalenivorans TaxID=441103 RepID=A0A0N7LYE6_9RHOB|nr:hypothetical protein [Tropicibacter naphthalenivorans]CUH74649.1 hypothetical protein TRN7648_00004 [Tropicibacter naphthalenivorans]SMC50065.1 hypothetical protein SAMN04488093_101875 [Tropicibacter naphthalenivorans]
MKFRFEVFSLFLFLCFGAPAAADCASSYPKNFTADEKIVWSSLCESGRFEEAGEIFNVIENEGEAEPPIVVVTESKALSSNFMRAVFANGKYSDAIPFQNISLRGVYFEHLDLSYAQIQKSLFLSESYADSININHSTIKGSWEFIDVSVGLDVSATSARVDGSFSLQNSVIGSLSAFQLELKGNLNINDTTVQDEANLEGSNVGGWLNFRHSTAAGRFNAKNARAGFGIDLSDSMFEALVSVGYARSKIGLIFSRSRFKEDVTAFQFDTEGGFYGQDTIFESNVDVREMRVGRDVRFHRAQVEGVLDSRGVVVSGIIYLDGGVFHDLWFGTSEIGHISLYESAAIFGSLNLDFSILKGLHFSHPPDGEANNKDRDFESVEKSAGDEVMPEDGITKAQRNTMLPIWSDDASLSLHRTKIDLLAGHFPQAFRTKSGNALPVDLRTADIEKFDFYDYCMEGTCEEPSINDRIAWIEGSRRAWAEKNDEDVARYTPKPYEHLAEDFRTIGNDEAARIVSYAKMKHRAQSRPKSFWGYFVRAAYDTPLQFIVGFGVYPWYAIFWFAGLVGVGTLLGVVYERKPREKSNWFWFRYSLENAIPLLDTSAEYKSVVVPNGKLTGWFLVLKIFGFVLVTIVVGSLTFG